jgi:hypothetical protein
MQVNPMGEGSWLCLKGFRPGCLLQPRPSTLISSGDKAAMDVAAVCGLKKTESNLFVVSEKEKR